jgi:chorismate dehydratase
MAFNYKRDVPSAINKALRKGHINAGFISSVESSRYRCTNLGIISNQMVYSVFVIRGEAKKDVESASSNQLAKILNLQGRVIIGDKALKYYLEGGKGADLSQEWYNQTKLPFVFGRLCFNCYKKSVQNIAKKFTQKPIKIPQYILKKEAKKRDITPKQLLWYLEHISYKMDYRSNKSLKLFLKLSKNKRIPYIPRISDVPIPNASS